MCSNGTGWDGMDFYYYLLAIQMIILKCRFLYTIIMFSKNDDMKQNIVIGTSSTERMRITHEGYCW